MFRCTMPADMWPGNGSTTNRPTGRKPKTLASKWRQSKYPKAAECLEKDKEELLAFYDFPAEQWTHIRTTNPIESTFSTVRHRTYKAKGAFSRTTILTMVFKLCESAGKSWRRLRGFNYLADVIRNVKFIDGIRQEMKISSVNEGEAA